MCTCFLASQEESSGPFRQHQATNIHIWISSFCMKTQTSLKSPDDTQGTSLLPLDTVLGRRRSSSDQNEDAGLISTFSCHVTIRFKINLNIIFTWKEKRH